MTLQMGDLCGGEKYAHLPRAISDGGTHQRTYEVGDIAYRPPGPDLAIFYRHDGQSIPGPDIVVIGKVDTGVDVLATYDSSVEATVTQADG
jgi:hypothetical protein